MRRSPWAVGLTAGAFVTAFAPEEQFWFPLAVGIGVFFAATLLWEMAAYVALFLVPLAVTGLVAAVGMWRQRQGAEPVGPRLLALLVFAGTLLTIVPAAQLLATR